MSDEARTTAESKLKEIELAMENKTKNEKAKKIDEKYKNIKFFGNMIEKSRISIHIKLKRLLPTP